MEKHLVRFILRYSLPEQLRVLALTLLCFPILYLSLELPKTIINEAIGAEQQRSEFWGFSVTPTTLLLSLCGMLLVTVLINGVLKMRVNTYKGVIGERLVRRLRYQLLERLLRFPPNQFQRIPQGEIIATVTSETEPLAGFIGDSLAQPLFQGGTMLTILVFMFVQDPVLGLLATSMIPLQAFIIPRMQKKLNTLKKARVKEVRVLANEISEGVDGYRDIRHNGTRHFHLAHFSQILSRLFYIRLDIFKQKFFMKFVNNFLNQLPPILFYAVGGILVIRGQLTIGALVAALTAYKDVVSPWKELLAYYQQYQDALVRYEQILENFNPEGLMDDKQAPASAPPPSSQSIGELTLQHLGLKNDRGDDILNAAQLHIQRGDYVVVQSDSPLLYRRLVRCLSQQESPSQGKLLLEDKEIAHWDEAALTQRLSFVGPDPFLFNGTVLQNIHYGMRRRPPEEEENLSLTREQYLEEALASGNSPHRIDEVWTDFSMAGMQGWDDMRYWLQAVMRAVGARQVVFEFALKDYFNPDDVPPFFQQKLLETRTDLNQRLSNAHLLPHVERFSANHYHTTLSLLENLCFTRIAPGQAQQISSTLVSSAAFIECLKTQQLYQPLCDLGKRIGCELLDQLATITPDARLPERFKVFDTACVRKPLGECLASGEACPADHSLLRLCFLLQGSALSKTFVSDELQQSIVSLRPLIQSLSEVQAQSDLDLIDPEKINKHLSVMENLIWGVERNPDDQEAHTSLINVVDQALTAQDAETLVLVLIGFSQVGIRGERMPLRAKENIQLMRALVKCPDILVMQEGWSSKPEVEQQEIIRGIKTLMPELTILCLQGESTARHDSARHYRIQAGRLETA